LGLLWFESMQKNNPAKFGAQAGSGSKKGAKLGFF
jgi:hypothetical protein